MASRIEFRQKDGGKVLFDLIVPPSGSGLKPFYMMDNKVSTGMFAEFADANPAAVASADWRKMGVAKLPVTRINAAEALQFARWLGGNLPTAQQWDFVAGLSNKAGRMGPSLKEATAAVGRSEPRNVDDGQDLGPMGINDLAGNGREWTRNILLADGTSRSGPLENPTARDLVIMRGRNFTLAKPLTYADLEFEEKNPQTQYYLKGSPYTTFRVVIEVND